MQHRRDASGAQQAAVVPVQVMRDEHRGRHAELVEGGEGGPVPTSGGVHRVDRRMQRQGAADGHQHRLVQPVGVGHLVDLALRSQLGQRLAEPDLALLLAPERGVTHGHQDSAGEPGPLGDQVRRRGPGRPVVDPDVRRLVARADVGDKRDGGDPASASRSTAAATSGVSGAFRITPSDPRWAMSSSTRRRCRRVAVLAQPRAGAHDCRAQRSQLGLQGVARSAGEPVGGLHHQVEDQRPCRELDLFVLAFELCDGLVDLGHRLRPDSFAAVQHPVDRGSAQSGLRSRCRPRDADDVPPCVPPSGPDRPLRR